MVNNLINPIRKSKIEATKIPEKDNNLNTGQYARLFVDSLDTEKRRRFKRMLEMGVNCGESIAKLYNVPVNDFIKEVKIII